MSGSGRKSQYRKSVTEEYLNGFPVPADGEVVGRVKSSRGTNIFELQLADGSSELAMMPTKFKKLIWIKRGDFVILSASAEAGERSASASGAVESFKVNFMIKHILTKPQVKHIQQVGLWDDRFDISGIQNESERSVGTTGRPGRSYQEDIPDVLVSDEDEGMEEEDACEEVLDKMGNSVSSR